MLRLLVISLGVFALFAAPSDASAQRRRYYHHPSPPRELTPEEAAAHDARTAALQARCDEVGRERCLEEHRAGIATNLRDVTRQNVVLVVLAVGAGLGFLVWRRREAKPRIAPMGAALVDDPWDLTVVELALEARQVPLARRNLDAILGAHPDRPAAAADVARALAGLSWTHVSLRQFPQTAAAKAQERHRAVCSEITSRGEVAVPQHDPGRGYRGEPGRDEPQLALVSLVVLSRAEIPEQVGAPADAARAVLERIARVPPAELVEVDVVWYPPGPGETTRASDLLARAPRLVPVG